MSHQEYHIIHLPTANRFQVDLPGEPAVLIYRIQAGYMLLLHTGVPEAYEGRGIAAMMARAVLDYAKDNGLKVKSFCSFTTRYIERHQEYKGLLG